MRPRSPVDVALTLLAILIRERTVKQSALARELDIAPRTVAKYLTTLYERNVPLESEQDHPNVFWSLSRHWIPGGVLLQDRTADALLHLLPLLPRSADRDAVLDEIRAARRNAKDPRAVVVPALAGEREFTHIVLLEDAALQHVVLRIRHLAAGPLHGVLHHISPICILAAPPIRVIAVCHDTGALELLRLDAFIEAREAKGETYRAADPVALEALLLAAERSAGGGEPANESSRRAA